MRAAISRLRKPPLGVARLCGFFDRTKGPLRTSCFPDIAMSRDASPFAVNTYSYTQSHGARDCMLALVGRGYSEFELMMYPKHLWP
ncbi:MAG TPA: hypothetical protein VGR65_07305, partial [Casimicrobiaceae bacterium]|nr:hypothetical protein [Casimicrobiaceae bacterium]